MPRWERPHCHCRIPQGLWLHFARCPARSRHLHPPNLLLQGLSSLRCGSARPRSCGSCWGPPRPFLQGLGSLCCGAARPRSYGSCWNPPHPQCIACPPLLTSFASFSSSPPSAPPSCPSASSCPCPSWLCPFCRGAARQSGCLLCSPVPLVRQDFFIDLLSTGKQGANLLRKSVHVDSELFFHRRVAFANQLDQLVGLIPVCFLSFYRWR